MQDTKQAIDLYATVAQLANGRPIWGWSSYPKIGSSGREKIIFLEIGKERRQSVEQWTVFVDSGRTVRNWVNEHANRPVG